MHRYTPYLLSDIEAAERPDTLLEITAPQTFEEEMEEIERWVAGGKDTEFTFSHYCGLSAEQFPPAAQLPDEDIILICKAFEHLLFTWNSGIDLPKLFPLHLSYQFMIDILSKEFTLVSSGFITYDFCTGNAPDCDFGKYCPCLKYWNEKDGEDKSDENSEEDSDEELPF